MNRKTGKEVKMCPSYLFYLFVSLVAIFPKARARRGAAGSGAVGSPGPKRGGG